MVLRSNGSKGSQWDLGVERFRRSVGSKGSRGVKMIKGQKGLKVSKGS